MQNNWSRVLGLIDVRASIDGGYVEADFCISLQTCGNPVNVSRGSDIPAVSGFWRSDKLEFTVYRN